MVTQSKLAGSGISDELDSSLLIGLKTVSEPLTPLALRNRQLSGLLWDLPPENPGIVIAELAHHHHKSVAIGDPERAFECAIEADEEAGHLLAYSLCVNLSATTECAILRCFSLR